MPHNPIYLDYNATTPIDSRVQSELKKAMSWWGNPSSIHQTGQFAKEKLADARETIATHIGASASQLIFTSSATEANNMVCRNALWTSLKNGTKTHLIISTIEHSSIRNTVLALAETGMVDVSYVGVDSRGLIKIDEITPLIQDNTWGISIMMANNETGIIQPIKAVAEIAATHGILCHTDAVQILGKQAINVSDLGVDFASFSAHKCYGPKGIGALYIKDMDRLRSIMTGGNHESLMRAGTENVMGAVGFAKALTSVAPEMDTVATHLKQLKHLFFDTIETMGISYDVNGDPSLTLPNTINIRFRNIPGPHIMMNLDLEGIAVSTGSACSTGSVDPSPILLAMGQSKDESVGAVRISMGKETSESDILHLCTALNGITQRLGPK